MTDELLEYFSNAVSECYKSPGNFFITIDECNGDHHLLIYPVLREIYGGPADGQTGYANYEININKLSKFFDKKPKVEFFTNNGVALLSVRGRIMNMKASALFFPFPPEQEPHEIMYVAGPKKGMVEKIEKQEN